MLKGGNTLYILRPWSIKGKIQAGHICTDGNATAGNKLDLQDATTVYSFVSQAFVMGLMEGELLRMLEHSHKEQLPACLQQMDDAFRNIHLMDPSSQELQCPGIQKE